MASDSKNTAQLKTQAHVFQKQHFVYDGSGRPIEIYTASTDTADGRPCSRVRYAYTGAGSNITMMKEDNSVWSDTWDIII